VCAWPEILRPNACRREAEPPDDLPDPVGLLAGDVGTQVGDQPTLTRVARTDDARGQAGRLQQHTHTQLTAAQGDQGAFDSSSASK
jgi:hypothetical protein